MVCIKSAAFWLDHDLYSTLYISNIYTKLVVYSYE